MLFAADIGNTTMTFGVINGFEVLSHAAIPTDENKTDLEYVLIFRSFLKSRGFDLSDIDGVIFSCVVPQLESVLSGASERIFGLQPIFVDSSCAFNFDIALPKKEELGANLIAISSAVSKDYGVPSVFVHLGTATAVGVLSDRGGYACYEGGVLYPGMQSALDQLTQKTSLPKLTVDSLLPLSGKNTHDSILSGVLYGHAGAIDRILEALSEAFPKAEFIITGRQAVLLKDILKHDVIFDETLSLRGLSYIFEAKKEESK